MAEAILHKKLANGTVKKWLDEVALAYEGDECLPFPFARMKSGHGRVSSRLGATTAHVYVAMKVLGEKTDPSHEVRHDCGNSWCVNPRHLLWGTRADNMNDRWRHGVMTLPPVKRGEANHKAVITETQARSAKKQLAAGVHPKAIAAQFGVLPGIIYNIKSGNSWGWLDQQPSVPDVMR